MRIQYNGIDMLLTRTNMWLAEPVYSRDGTDYLYTKHTLDVTCVYNPQATSYAGVVGGGAVLTAGSSPALTDILIKRLLLTPMRSLLYQLGGQVVLQSPKVAVQPGVTQIDALNGPRPLYCSVRPMGESKTWLVTWRVETWLSDCNTYGPDPVELAIASNRWETHHSIDRNDMTTLVTRGVAVFKMDALYALKPVRSADHFRDRVLPAVPKGFAREDIRVTLNDIGNIITYEVVDRQQSVCLGLSTEKGTPAYAGVKSFRCAFTAAVNPISGAAGGHDNVQVAGPFTNVACDIQVEGHVASSRADLEIFAMKLVVERMKIADKPNLVDHPGVSSIIVTENLDRKAVSVRVTGWVAMQQGQALLGLGPIPRTFLGIDRFPVTFAKSAGGGDPGGPTSQKPNDKNTRGTWNVEAFAQAIQGACLARLENIACAVNDGAPDDNQSACAPTVVVQVLTADDLSQYGKTSRFKTIDGRLDMDTKIQKSYGTSSGKVAAPIASTPAVASSPGAPPPAATDTVEIMTLSQPYSTLVVEWECASMGKKPAIPSPIYNDKTYVLMSWNVNPSTVQPIIADGDVLGYRVAGSAVYAIKRPIDPGTGEIFMGIVPWANVTNDEATLLMASDPQHGIVDQPIATFSGSPVGPNI